MSPGQPRSVPNRTWDLRLSHTPDTAEDSKPTAELPLLLRPVAALRPRISAAERSRSLYFRCKKQQKQRGATDASSAPSARSGSFARLVLLTWRRYTQPPLAIG